MPVRALLLVALGLALGSCGGGEAPPGVVGRWTLDVQRSTKARLDLHLALRQEMLENTAPERREEASRLMIDGDVEGNMRRQVEQMRFTLDVRADGTFSSDMTRPEIPHERLGGVWAKAGEQYTFTFTQRDGKPVAAPPRSPMKIELRDGGLAQVDERGRPLGWMMRAPAP
jgi:hypothetical protein